MAAIFYENGMKILWRVRVGVGEGDKGQVLSVQITKKDIHGNLPI
jgi:hypothetical protein